MGAVYKARYKVYWSETDAAGIMHFSNHFRVCERVEEDFVRSLGFEYTAGSRITFPRVHAECDYKAPLRAGDEYTVTITGVELGRSSITYKFSIYNESLGREAARCVIVAVAYDNIERRPVELPGEFRSAIENALRELETEQA